MGKIVKYCGSCDEGFAEKFGFCPNCGATLEAFEMNPLEAKASPAEAIADVPPAPEFIAAPVADAIKPSVEEAPVIEEPAILKAAPVEAAPEPEITKETEKPVARSPKPLAAATAPPVFVQTTTLDADRIPVSLEDEHSKYAQEGGFYVTVIEAKNVRQRGLLLLGSTLFMITFALGAMLFSLFQKDIGIGAIGNDSSLASLLDEVPMIVEEEQQKKDKEAGGGGGGGREEKDPVNKGDMADQTPDPIRAPDVKIPKLTDPSMVLPTASTKGNMKFDKTYGQIGDPNSSSDALSNGQGSGGGVGSGRGLGQGSGNGLGAGSGNGSGYGNGNGNGNGDGTGDGTSGPPPVLPRGVTQGIKIISKPRPGYTDSARQANIQGTVILRVTFLGSGQIGSISPVKGLGNGLTEQAIAAARRISFEPAKTNGVGQTVTKQIEYTFSIY